MKKLEHIGIAVKNLEASNKLFTLLLGKAPYKVETVESEGVRTSFFQLQNLKIELLEATHPDSPIAKFIAKKGEGIHHIAFDVEDVEQDMERHAANGFTTALPSSRRGAENKKINFLHPRTTNGVLVELCQDMP